jgi:hypothetical protein
MVVTFRKATAVRSRKGPFMDAVSGSGLAQLLDNSPFLTLLAASPGTSRASQALAEPTRNSTAVALWRANSTDSSKERDHGH